MDMKDFGWERVPPEIETGDYWFDGKFLATALVVQELSKAELLLLYADIRNEVGQNGGQDFLQVSVQKEKNYNLFLIDNVTRASLLAEEIASEHNACTLMFNPEY